MSVELNIQVAPDLSLLPSEAELMTWVKATLPKQHAPIELSIRFVGSEEMKALNKQYREKDKHTNVLSFPNPMPAELRDAYLGDIVVCIPVIELEALEQHKTPLAHYAHMIVHGILHLLGYDHQIDAEAIIMENIEVTTLANLGFPNPYGDSSSHG